MADLWTQPNGYTLGTVIERQTQNIQLPLVNENITVSLISGSLPAGLTIKDNAIIGTPFEVPEVTVNTFVLRASFENTLQDRTFEIIVVGEDDPVWITPPGFLQLNQEAFFVLDSELVNFQLEAIDPDEIAGDELSYFIKEGSGELPPGLRLTTDGRIVGVVEPLLALDRLAGNGAYDGNFYDNYPIDFAALPDNGYASFFYDTQTFDFSQVTLTPKKLNRYYQFTLIVTDGNTNVEREFRIFVVGDDFLRADNTVIRVGNGVFTADNTYQRKPIWLTPNNLGFKRADNYVTIPLEVLDTEAIVGNLSYDLEPVNDDGSLSTLPPGLRLDSGTGLISGVVPYRAQAFEEFKFTVRATRYDPDLETAFITGIVYEDTLAGNSTIRIFKLDQSLDDDVDDLQELIERTIQLDGNSYRIVAVNGTITDYDEITVVPTIQSRYPLIVKETASPGDNYAWVNKLTSGQKEQYANRQIKFSDTEFYNIQSISSYLEYNVKDRNQQLGINQSLYPQVGSVQSVSVTDRGLNYISASVSFESDSGFGATADAVLDEFGRITNIVVTNGGEGYTSPPTVVLTGEFSGTVVEASAESSLVYETFEEQAVRLFSTAQLPAYLEYVSDREYNIKMPNTASNRNFQRVFDTFSQNNSDVSLSVVDNQLDRLQFDVALARTIVGDISIGVFKNSFFEKAVVTQSTDEVANPFTVKTFTLNLLGNVDSRIEWITDSDLGSIKPNLISTLAIEAASSIPGTKLVYEVISGNLPSGLTLTYDGQIIGKVTEISGQPGRGLTVFDSGTTSFDLGLDTTFDRINQFTVRVRDRFNYSAIERTFTLSIDDADTLSHSNIYARPYLSQSVRNDYNVFASDINIFPPEDIYRPNDPEFGVQNQLEMLVYAGIEAKSIAEFVSAISKNHKRKRFIIGDLKTAVAKNPGSNEIVYEVIYLEIIDPSEPASGKTRNSFSVNTEKTITVDSIQYAAKDDVTKKGAGYPEILIQGRNIDISIPLDNPNNLDIETRDGGTVENNTSDNDIDIETRNQGNVEVSVNITDSEPYRLRPETNTIKSDSNAVKVSNSKDNVKYITNISNMRDRIAEIGDTESDYLPLWMRTRQTLGSEVPGYRTAIPIVYCKAGTGESVLQNIKNSDFDFKKINFEIDRYIIDSTNTSSQEQYLLFANYQFNV